MTEVNITATSSSVITSFEDEVRKRLDAIEKRLSALENKSLEYVPPPVYGPPPERCPMCGRYHSIFEKCYYGEVIYDNQTKEIK